LRRSAETPLRPHHDHPQTPQRQQRAGNFSQPQSGAAKSSPLDEAMIFSTIVRLTVLEISLMDDFFSEKVCLSRPIVVYCAQRRKSICVQMTRPTLTAPRKLCHAVANGTGFAATIPGERINFPCEQRAFFTLLGIGTGLAT